MFISPCIVQCIQSKAYVAEMLVCLLFITVSICVYIHLQLPAAISPYGINNFHPCLALSNIVV